MDKFFALSEEKQITIINAALQCFGKFGYDKASVNDIAVTAHISKASVFQYFGSKKQLYTYLLEYCMKIIMPSFDQTILDSETDLFNRILVSSKMKMAAMKTHPFITQFMASVWAAIMSAASSGTSVRISISVILSSSPQDTLSCRA